MQDALEFALRNKEYSGHQIDGLMSTLGVNFLQKKIQPCITLEMPDIAALVRMASDGEAVTYLSGSDLRYLVIYPPKRDGFPLARVYYVEEPSVRTLENAYNHIIAHSGEPPPPAIHGKMSFRYVDSKEFGILIEDRGHEDRSNSYLAKFENNNGQFSEILDGRIKSTFIEKGMILSSEGCLVCKGEAGLLLSSVGAEQGLLIGFYLCPDHFVECQQSDTWYFEYIASIFNVSTDWKTFKPDSSFLMVSAKTVLINILGCTVEKVHGDTVTARRPSGLVIRMRVSSLADYAYMIFDETGKKQLRRIDSADHHDLRCFPDHLHPSPETDSKNVEESFTYGFPSADIKILQRLLSELEKVPETDNST